MRFIPFSASLLVTIVLIVVLNKRWGTIPDMGNFLSPQHGFWQNAEPVDRNYDADIKIRGLKSNAEIYFDDRLVPHVFAENDEDGFPSRDSRRHSSRRRNWEPRDLLARLGQIAANAASASPNSAPDSHALDPLNERRQREPQKFLIKV